MSHPRQTTDQALKGCNRKLQSRHQWRDRCRVGLILLSKLAVIAAAQPAVAQSSAPSQPEPPEVVPHLRPQVTCPRDVEVLMSGLIRDLPSYANRVAYRSIPVTADPTGFGTLLVAGQAEFEPIDVSTLTFDANAATPETIQQVFFTTLEWQYQEDEIVPLEQYHWLFLTEADDGWRLALMFSRIANDEVVLRPPTPRRESSDGIIGQAVQLWLRDCRAGAIYPIDSSVDSTGAVDAEL